MNRIISVWNHLTMCKQMIFGSFQNIIYKSFQIIYIYYV